MNMKGHITAILVIVGISLHAQELSKKETWVSGYARSILLTDTYDDRDLNDTVTSNVLMSGHTLLDLAANIKPTESIFIQGNIRIRNDHGGFWGSGVTFDVRNLYLRGVVGNAFRYQLGDVNYKLTEYTFFNPDEELSRNQHAAFSWMQDMTRYDLFYDENNTWRQQGVTGEFGLRFKKNIEEMDFNLFTMRLNTFETAPFEQLYSGARISLKQSDLLDFHVNYVHAYDLLGTTASTDRYDNAVVTGGLGLHHDVKDWGIDFNSEVGTSNELKILGEDTLELDDYFTDFSVKFENKKINLGVTIGYQNVGPQFRSIGAQSKRLMVNARPRAFTRIGNEQAVRAMGMLDMMRDASLYNTQLSSSLMDYNMRYGNFRPYGVATPNRNAMTLRANWTDKKKVVELAADYIMASEVTGSGTEDLKDFSVWGIQAVLHGSTLLGLDRQMDLTLGFDNEHTTRDDGFEPANVDLRNEMLQLGLELGLVDELKFVFGYRNLRSLGNDFLVSRTDIGQVTNYSDTEVDMREELLALGLRYDFNEKSMLTLQYSAYTRKDVDEIGVYRLNDLAILYKINF